MPKFRCWWPYKSTMGPNSSWNLILLPYYNLTRICLTFWYIQYIFWKIRMYVLIKISHKGIKYLHLHFSIIEFLYLIKVTFWNKLKVLKHYWNFRQGLLNRWTSQYDWVVRKKKKILHISHHISIKLSVCTSMRVTTMRKWSLLTLAMP